MSELPSDELSIAASGANPGRRKAAAQARGAQSFAVTSARAAVLSGTGEILGTTETLSSWKRFAFASGSDARETCKEAKEEVYCCGLLATAVFEEEIGARVVTWFPLDTGVHGRTVATCQVNGRIFRSRMAIAYLRYSKYMEAGVGARRAMRGVWQGDSVEPEEFHYGGRQR
jgi:hypothetical protein